MSLRRFVIRWEMTFYLLAVASALASVVALVLFFPNVSNLAVSIFVLVSSFFSITAAAISAIKTREPE